MAAGQEEGPEASYEERAVLSPLEVERDELGYRLEEVRGRSLRVIRNESPGSAGGVFFVHGGGGRGGQFKHQFKALKKDFQVVAFDFLGHGDSPKPNRPGLYTENEHFEDLLAIYEEHKRERNVLVAHCYGCIHVLRLLKHLSGLNRLGEVSGLVVMALGSNTPAGGSSSKVISKLPAFILEWLRPLARASSNAALFSSTCDPALIEFENAISDNNRMYTMKAILADCSDQAKWDQWLAEGQEALTVSAIPRTMICGDSDGIFSVPHCEYVRGLLDIPAESFHVVKEAGHLMMIEKPDEVTKVIRDFVVGEAKLISADSEIL